MSRWSTLAYAVLAYVLFLATFLYAIGFLGNFLVPRSIDRGPAAPLGEAVIIDTLLLAVFALQHSVMARPAFKRWLLRTAPPPVERSTYVLHSSLALALLFWQWRPIEGIIWQVSHPLVEAVLWSLFAIGWLTVLITTFLISHFDLFGLRQGWLYFRGRECTPLKFVMPGPYHYVRHPLYIGWLLTFWATPVMSAAHLIFAVGTTLYILVAIQFEERDLVAAHGPSYAEYRRQVPMLIPRFGRSPSSATQNRVVVTRNFEQQLTKETKG
jgi:protein-S-isoprenylcysteine O-methyltransferase Ste14